MKKTLAILLAMALLCIMAVGTTLTYFTDHAGQANIMTVGEVKIEQIEQQRDGDAYKAFDPNSTKLYPYTGKGDKVGGWLKTTENAVDKIVTVKNTGSEDAFIRTLIAFEAVESNDPVVSGAILVNYNQADGVGIWKSEGSFTNNSGVTYFVYSFTYKEALAGGTNSVSDPSLKQIALSGDAGNSFSGGSYDILVLSQAVQFQGFADADAAFEAAFPITEVELAEWFQAL